MPAKAATWEVEVSWRESLGEDPRAAEIAREVAAWTGVEPARVRAAELYYLQGELTREQVELAARALLSDPVTQEWSARVLESPVRPAALGSPATRCEEHAATVLKKAGVMDPVEGSLLQGLSDLGIEGVRVRTGLRVALGAPLDAEARRLVAERVLSNAAVEDVYWDGEPIPSPFSEAAPYRFRLATVPLEGLDSQELLGVSRKGQLSLDLEEMRAIQEYFARRGRPPADVELETLAQTWSEHCCHKTFTSAVEHHLETAAGEEVLSFDNLLRETIVRATEEVRRRREEAGREPFLLSVFTDNAGVVAFDEEYGVSFKAETHNHPSALEPYGGAGTGIGGVLRDTLGTGLGAKPIVNTDVFCVGPQDTPQDLLPPGTLHPRRVLQGVIGGVRDYGNRMGIPTASGALYFDERYIANPLVFCGSVGLLPRSCVDKKVEPGDLIFVLGGRTGRDGIHGATFSSAELTEDSESLSGGAVQIGNPITEKKLLDVLLEARDRGLFRAVTDCGAGGLSSAVGEMGRHTGARVELDRVPLKYEGLSYAEIWISEAQERMVLAVPPGCREALVRLARSEDVECTEIGVFTETERLELFYEGHQVADLEMGFLHEGRPRRRRLSRHRRPAPAAADLDGAPAAGKLLRAILAAPNVCSREWVIRQYDHEVQGRCVLKPLQGARSDGPGDGVVFAPRFDSLRGIAVACGMNPLYGDLDPFRMALSAVDEAVRNAVAAGADPDRLAVLDNFCWGNTDPPETLGSLVEAARGSSEAAIVLGTPFISGKDSLNNEFRSGDKVVSIPPSLLISAIGVVEDVRRAVSTDLKAPGHRLILAGRTRPELGGSHLLRVLGRKGGEVPGLEPAVPQVHRAVARLLARGLAVSCHDLAEGGLAVAAAEMAFSGEVGAEIRLERVVAEGCRNDLEILFSESNGRYLLEVEAERVKEALGVLAGLPAAEVGETIPYGILRVVGREGSVVLAEALADLERAWKAENGTARAQASRTEGGAGSDGF